ncbi:hypothetical protein OOK13_04855 [Streptomyces sp. NBC_00378]|uniref:hypothetical protein n=1 Tax=unclassified Streptomyces TaxID=2593676 RepID=UPI002253AF09|nr:MULTISPECIES: hypothetical protein [unclassified Streptomyces]MCX5107856.1 hypothetical protein [Streptomyces sp. NBC_00378]
MAVGLDDINHPPHGVKADVITQRGSRRKELLDDSPGYVLATDVALKHGAA